MEQNRDTRRFQPVEELPTGVRVGYAAGVLNVDNDGKTAVEVLDISVGFGQIPTTIGVVSPNSAKRFQVHEAQVREDFAVMEQAELARIRNMARDWGRPPVANDTQATSTRSPEFTQGNKDADEDPDDDQKVLIGSGKQPSILYIDDRHYQLGEIVRLAFEKSGLSVDAWNSLSEEHREQAIADQIDSMMGPAE